LQQREVASGELLAALGSFDLNLSTDSRNWGLGYYKRYLYDVFFEQPLQSWGAKLFAGYRLGAGDWPIYYQYLQTNGGGAYVAGMDVSLLRDGWIDAKRAKLYQAELERRKVEPAISKQRISLLKDAAKSYWSWVGAGLGYGVYEKLLTVAEVRNRALERQVREGAVAPVELVDNQRVVLSRQSTLIAARRRFQQATIDLSLYLRDGYGLPTLAEPERLPEDFPPIEPPDPNRLPEDFEVAVRLRPELRSLQLDGLKIDIDRQLAENQRLPGLNLYLYSEQNVGAPVPLRNKGPFLLESSLLMEVPLQRRFARGRVVAANAALRQNRYAEQYARDRIIADVQDGFSALQTSYEQWLRLNEAVRLNRELEQAEIRRFATGASNILFVNIREQATADAQIYAIEAATKYFFSLADYRAALGVDALPPGTISP
jgi:outer membrane protein TolC